MSCYHPRPAFEQVDCSTGEVFYSIWTPRLRPVSKVPFQILKSFKVPCRQCIGCRSSYSLHWSIRASNEAMYHKENCFITLTVDDKFMEKIFPGRSLTYEPFQLFIRYLRRVLHRPGLKFYMCGEYGELLSRPHYHAIIFGWFPDNNDRRFFKSTPVGDIFVSNLLKRLWPYGFSTVANFSKDCAQYVAGYINKKINGKQKDSHYGDLEPEFSECSKKLGRQFYLDYRRDIYNGRDSMALPGGGFASAGRYYDKLHAHYHPSHMEGIKRRRSLPDPIRDFLNSPSQLKAREVNHRARLKNQGRNNF